jgi:hypothetical protein
MGMGKQHVYFIVFVLGDNFPAQQPYSCASITYDGVATAFNFDTNRVATDFSTLIIRRCQRAACSPELYTKFTLGILRQIFVPFAD